MAGEKGESIKEKRLDHAHRDRPDSKKKKFVTKKKKRENDFKIGASWMCRPEWARRGQRQIQQRPTVATIWLLVAESMAHCSRAQNCVFARWDLVGLGRWDLVVGLGGGTRWDLVGLASRVLIEDKRPSGYLVAHRHFFVVSLKVVLRCFKVG